jgi:hypothetical protein
MTRQLARLRPDCGGFMIVKVFEPERHTALQTVNGRCGRWQDRLVSIVNRGNRRSLRRHWETLEATPEIATYGRTMRLIDDVLWFAVGFLVIILIAVNVFL